MKRYRFGGIQSGRVSERAPRSTLAQNCQAAILPLSGDSNTYAPNGVLKSELAVKREENKRYGMFRFVSTLQFVCRLCTMPTFHVM